MLVNLFVSSCLLVAGVGVLMWLLALLRNQESEEKSPDT